MTMTNLEYEHNVKYVPMCMLERNIICSVECYAIDVFPLAVKILSRKYQTYHLVGLASWP